MRVFVGAILMALMQMSHGRMSNPVPCRVKKCLRSRCSALLASKKTRKSMRQKSGVRNQPCIYLFVPIAGCAGRANYEGP